MKFVTPCASMSRNTVGGSIARRHTCVPAAAVTAQGIHQPLQWNMGSVHRNTVRCDRPSETISPMAFRKPPRCVYMTPLGTPVVPEV